MKEALITIVSILITGIAVLLCLCCIYLGSKSDEYWQKLKERLENKND